MKQLIFAVALALTVSVALGVEPIPIVSKGTVKGKIPHQSALWGKIAPSSDGSEPAVIHWIHTGDNSAGLTILPEHTDWTKHNALRFRYYGSGMIGKRFKFIIAPTFSEGYGLPVSYHHVTITVEREGWNEAILPLTYFEHHKCAPGIPKIGYLLLMSYGWEIPSDQGLKLEISDLELVD